MELDFSKVPDVQFQKELSKRIGKFIKTIYLPGINYDVIYCDPPWSYDDKNANGKRGAEFKYDCMSMEELFDMRGFLRSISAKDCACFMWVTMPFLVDGMELMKAWGFKLRPNPVAFVWVKTNKGNGKPFKGLGHFTRGNAELCIVGERGKPKHAKGAADQLLISERMEHSRKPEEFHKRIEALYQEAKKIELFARRPVEGWDVWGNEV